MYILRLESRARTFRNPFFQSLDRCAVQSILLKKCLRFYVLFQVVLGIAYVGVCCDRRLFEEQVGALCTVFVCEYVFLVFEANHTSDRRIMTASTEIGKVVL